MLWAGQRRQRLLKLMLAGDGQCVRKAGGLSTNPPVVLPYWQQFELVREPKRVSRKLYEVKDFILTC